MLAPGRSDTRATRRPSRRPAAAGRSEKWVAASLQRPPSLAHLSVTAAIAPDRADHDRKSWRQQPAPAARRRCTWPGGQRETKKMRAAGTGPAPTTRKTVSTVPAAGPRQPGPTALSRPTPHLPRAAGGCLPIAAPCPEAMARSGRGTAAPRRERSPDVRDSPARVPEVPPQNGAASCRRSSGRRAASGRNSGGQSAAAARRAASSPPSRSCAMCCTSRTIARRQAERAASSLRPSRAPIAAKPCCSQ